jgi:hypothetical protein
VTSLTTNLKNVAAARRGSVAGLLVSFHGLSSALYGGLYREAFEPSAAQFLLFCALFGLVVCLGGPIALVRARALVAAALHRAFSLLRRRSRHKAAGPDRALRMRRWR